MNSFNLLFYILTNNLRYLSTYDYLRYHYYSNMSMNFQSLEYYYSLTFSGEYHAQKRGDLLCGEYRSRTDDLLRARQAL